MLGLLMYKKNIGLGAGQALQAVLPSARSAAP
jgi:hypothetical protein